jgi:HK97 family phage portal protein
MAWNSSSNKSLQSGIEEKRAQISVGAPVAYSPTIQGNNRGYHDGWDIVKTYKEAVAKVTWVYRSIDVIASNQASLPMILRKDNNPFGEIVTENPILKIFNNTANIGENAWAFRYRLSSQLLMSTRGVFVEIVRSRDGTPIAMHLLPPQNTSPIPDVKNFVKGFEVKINAMEKRVIKPSDVIWVRRPHPLDPYLSMTPMEAAGIAIEQETLAKLYNRNFLINDGRPGGLLVLRSEISEEDKDELRSRFRGNIGRAGAVGVISSDDGADFVDTAASPRDASYQQMRTITKEEILAAFGVPESIIGNSANRTFSNAMEEGKVFWMETMTPHLNLIARSFDAIDESYFVDFDTSNVPILILSKQEREKHYLSEFQQGLISTNEYRDASARKKVESELADSLLANPNLTPLANTEKPMQPEGEGQGMDAGAGMDPMANMGGGTPPAPRDAGFVETGVPLQQQATAALQEQVTEFSPEEGAFVPLGDVQGTQRIEAPASAVPSELDAEGEKSLPLEQRLTLLENLLS